jgi:GDPmannose 4,6-dehydratase/GDP-4-dehydro-6-deoxy-D-mannose reductase
MSENILITGITGSGGSYLADYILEFHPRVNIYGLHRWHSTGSLSNIEHMKNRINIIECDLLDLSSIIRALKISKPTRIFHLAAFANVRKCFDTPLAVINNNIMGTANLLEGIRLECPDAVIQICSTSEVYGNPLLFPMTEDHPQVPVNPYAVSKQTQERLAYAYFKSFGLRIIITRMFAYINPRRRDLFATAFAYQIAQIEKGNKQILEHGNLDSIRTLIDVRDAMRSYWIASEQCDFGVAYNIGGNDVLSVGDFLDILIKHAKIEIKTFQDPKLMRPIDVTKQIPDASKFNALTGFKCKYSLDESVDFLLECMRKQ